MLFKAYIIIFIATLFLITKTASGFSCSFGYTVDLSESEKLENNSYIYNNDTLITPDLVHDYNIKILDNGTKIETVENYKRGCICEVKKCMRFCRKRVMEIYKNNSLPDIDKKFTKNVTLANGTVIEKHLIHDFYPIFGTVKCESVDIITIVPESYPNHNWTMYEVRRYNKKS